MKRKMVMLLTGSALTLAMTVGSAQAKTYGYDLGDGSSVYYFVGESSVESYAEETGESTDAYDETMLTEDERQKCEAWHKASMQEAVAYVEKYGVSYDAENDRLLYNGQTVRWLIDEQIDDCYEAIRMPEGEIDLYTVRAADYTLTGVRQATQEEYDERTRQDEMTEKQAYSSQGLVAESKENTENETVVEAIEEGTGTWTGTGEEKKRAAEYARVGIIRGNNGSFLWNGKAIYFLLDEDGSMTVNNTSETKDEKIYILVTRNEDGSIKEAKQVTSEEILQEKMKKEDGET